MLSEWTELEWARQSAPAVAAAASLSPRQRLLLGLVVFGQMRYQAAAARTGVAADEVSSECAAALRQLSGALSAGGRVPHPRRED